MEGNYEPKKMHKVDEFVYRLPSILYKNNYKKRPGTLKCKTLGPPMI